MTTVLLITFNRPEMVKEAIKPLLDVKTLYLFKDGKSPQKTGEEIIQIFEEAKKIREKQGRKTRILTPTENLGQRDGPITAIKWMLENEGQGIIIEEDIIATPYLLEYYQKNLEEYKTNKEIIAIVAGVKNTYKKIKPYGGYKSKLFLPWGWATWWDKFKNINIPNDNWNCSNQHQKKEIINEIKSTVGKLHQKREFDLITKDPNYCWSYYIQTEILKNKNYYTIIPATKLSKNIGISKKSLRTKNGKDKTPIQNEIIEMMKHPTKVKQYCPKTESYIEKQKFGSLLLEIKRKIKLKEKLKKFYELAKCTPYKL